MKVTRIMENSTLVQGLIAYNHAVKQCNRLNSKTKLPYRFQSIYDIVLQKGVEFKVPPLRPEEEFWVPLSTPKFCFCNAMEVAFSNPEKYIYVEGYSHSPRLPGFPMHHAWVYNTKHKEIFDPTWGNADEGLDYIGIPFKSEFVKQHYEENEENICILDQWEKRFPILTGELDVDEIKYEIYNKTNRNSELHVVERSPDIQP